MNKAQWRKTRPVGFGPGSVAQLVERSTENRKVTGSMPVGATIFGYFPAIFISSRKMIPTLLIVRLTIN